METSPLTLAHNHARNALTETRRANPVAASEEHDLASAEYAAATDGISDSEALRTLHLLEQHHKRLGQILKFQHENPSDVSQPSETLITESPLKVQHSSNEIPGNDKVAHTTGQEQSNVPPRLSSGSTAPSRKISASIASNLASARGIPPNPQSRRATTVSPALSAQQADGKFAKQSTTISGRSKTRSRSENASKQEPFFSPNDSVPFPESSAKVPEPVLKPTASEAAKSESTIAEQTFQQFYSAFETVISKISAPLAFASIPLTGSSAKVAAESKPSHQDVSKKSKSQPWTAESPSSSSSIHTTVGLDEGPLDYSKLISKAALRAVSEDNPTVFGNGNPAESFYVVPTTGGTVSYAGILNRPERNAHEGSGRAHTRQLSNISEDTVDNFVDAREVPFSSASASPEINRDRQRSKQSRKQDMAATKNVGGKAMEELYLENQTLRNACDTLSKRLQMWEVNAQSSSAALQQSLRSLRNQPRGESPGQMPSDASTEENAKTVADLEELVRKAEADKERHKRENEKLKDVVERYRDRWEKLKEGARARKEGQGAPRSKSEVPLDLAHDEGGHDETVQ